MKLVSYFPRVRFRRERGGVFEKDLMFKKYPPCVHLHVGKFIERGKKLAILIFSGNQFNFWGKGECALEKFKLSLQIYLFSWEKT